MRLMAALTTVLLIPISTATACGLLHESTRALRGWKREQSLAHWQEVLVWEHGLRCTLVRDHACDDAMPSACGAFVTGRVSRKCNEGCS